MKKTTKKNHPPTPSWLRWCWHTALKLLIVLLFLLSFYGIYLDSKIKNKFEGQRWQIPVQVYGKIEQVSVGDEVSPARLKRMLQLTGYQQKSQVCILASFLYQRTS